LEFWIVQNEDKRNKRQSRLSIYTMPQTITPIGMELNPITEPIEDPVKPTEETVVEENKTY